MYLIDVKYIERLWFTLSNKDEIEVKYLLNIHFSISSPEWLPNRAHA